MQIFILHHKTRNNRFYSFREQCREKSLIALSNYACRWASAGIIGKDLARLFESHSPECKLFNILDMHSGVLFCVI